MATYTRSKITRSHMGLSKSSDPNDTITRIIGDFNAATKAPEKFISPQVKTASKLTTLTKQLFDFGQQNLTDDNANLSSLSELIIDNFDDEQVWQEIELHNDPFLRRSFQGVAKVIASKDRCTFLNDNKSSEHLPEEDDVDDDDDDDDDSDEVGEDQEEDNLLEYSGSQDLFPEMQTQEEDGDEEVEQSDDESETNFDIDALENKSKSKTRQTNPADETILSKRGNTSKQAGKTSVVDDQFFKLSEMDKFLEFEDAKEERRRDEEEGKGRRKNDDDDDDDSDDSIDYFKELPSEDEAGLDGEDDDEDEEDQEGDLFNFKNAKDFVYKDFFPGEDEENSTPRAEKSVRFDEGSDPGDEMMGEEDEEDGEEEVEEEEEAEEEEDEMDEMENEGDKDQSGVDAEARQALSGLLRDSDDESEGEDALDILGRRKPQEDESNKSSFEKRQDRLKEKINQLEEANIAKKPWQLMGEVTSGKRPDNSLLEVDLEFDATPKAGVEITEDTTKSLEDIIRQRILDQAWDDVERKMKPKEDLYEYKKRVTLDQEKSKASLAEIYEQEYIKQTQGEKEAEEDPAHVEIRTSMEALFLKLDALSNFHYTPKPAVPEVKIVSNLPSITIEEVAPVTTTDATLLAPQEIQEKQKGELKGDTEKTDADKNRARKEKKTRQRLRAQQKEKRQNLVDKLNPGLGNKYSKRAAMEKLEKSSKVVSSRTTIIKDTKSHKKSLSSSKSFFSQLQDEVTAQVHGLGKGKKKTNKTPMSSAKLKL